MAGKTGCDLAQYVRFWNDLAILGRRGCASYVGIRQGMLRQCRLGTIRLGGAGSDMMLLRIAGKARSVMTS